MNNSKLGILSCQHYFTELSSVINENSNENIILYPFKSKCGLANKKDLAEYEKALTEIKIETSDIKIIAPKICFSCIDISKIPKNEEYCPVNNCFELIIPKSFSDQLIAEGNYIVTPGWLKNWKQIVQNKWGFNYETAKLFFKESAKQIILLNTEVHNNFLTQISEFADFTGLNYKIINIGIDYFRLYINKIIQEWESAKKLRNDTKVKLAMNEKIANFAMLYDIFPKLVVSTSEEELVKSVNDLFKMFFSPKEIVYIPIKSGKVCEIISTVPEKYYDIESLTNSFNFNSLYEVTKSKNGLKLKISYNNENFAFILIDNLQFPENIKSYTQILNSISAFLGLFISNTRQYNAIIKAKEEIEHHKELIKRKNLDLQAVNEELRVNNEQIKSAKQKIEESENNFRSLFNKNPLSLWEEDFSLVHMLLEKKKKEGVTDFNNYFNKNPDFLQKCISELKIINTNNATLELLKFETKKELFQNLKNTFNKKSFETVTSELVAIANNEKSFSEETELLDSKGNLLNVIIQFNVIQDYKKVILVITDITEIRKTEKALKESEQNLKNAQEIAKIGSWEYNPQTDKTTWSENMYKLFNRDISIGEPKGKDFTDYIHPNDIKRVTSAYKNVLSSLKPEKLDFRTKPKNGNIHWFDLIIDLKINTLEKFVSLAGTMMDITDRKHAEQELKESREKYKTIFENAATSIILVDKKGIITYINQYHLDNIAKGKVSEERYLGKNIISYPSILAAGIGPDYEKVLKGEKISLKAVHFSSSTGGGELYLNIKGVPIYKDNKIEEAVFVHENITELKKTEKQLLESNATKDKFFSIIAHDLKSPFNTMLGFSELLLQKFEQYNKEKIKDLIQIIRFDIENTYKLLENLLLWSQSQRGMIEFKPAKENLYLLTNQTVELLTIMASTKKICLKNKVPENIFVYTDNNMFLTIIRNLISNAIKFTPKNGEIIIKANSITTKNYKNYIEISVKDNGIGISDKMKTKLFKITENISTSGTGGEAGTGLGLLLCKEFIEKHGGRIWVESETGKGSEFIFTLETI